MKRIKSAIKHHLEAWFIRHLVFSIWLPPPLGSLKVNFDAAIHPSFVVATATLRDQHDDFFVVHSLRLLSIDTNKGKALAALLATQLVFSFDCSSLIIKGDSLLPILTLNQLQLFEDWHTESIF